MIGLGLVSVTSLAAHDLFSKGSSFTATKVLGSVSYLEVCFLFDGFGAYTQSTKKYLEKNHLSCFSSRKVA